MSTKRRFIHLSRAWYGPAVLRDRDCRDEVMFGLYTGEGGCEGEMAVRWYDFPQARSQGARLEAFDDSWATLGQFQDVINRMASALPGRRGACISPQEFCWLLGACGFEDATPAQAAQGGEV